MYDERVHSNLKIGSLITVVCEIFVISNVKMFEILLAIVTIIFVFLFAKYGIKPAKFPPGPARIPFIGSLPFLPSEVKNGKKKFQTYLQEVQKIHCNSSHKNLKLLRMTFMKNICYIFFVIVDFVCITQRSIFIFEAIVTSF